VDALLSPAAVGLAYNESKAQLATRQQTKAAIAAMSRIQRQRKYTIKQQPHTKVHVSLIHH